MLTHICSALHRNVRSVPLKRSLALLALVATQATSAPVQAAETTGITLAAPMAIPQSILSLRENRTFQFNRVDEASLREMSVGGSQTIDVGHVQVELDLASTAYERVEEGVLSSTSIAPMTVRLGILPNIEMGFQWAPYEVEQSRLAASNETKQGRGDLVAQVKFNLWGNDGEDSGLAVQPYVKFPTASNGMGNDAIEMGMVVPLDLALPYEFALGVENDLGMVRSEEGTAYQATLATSIAFQHPLFDCVDGYISMDTEVAGLTKEDLGMSVGAGFSYVLSKSMVLDAGISTGVPDPGNSMEIAVSAAARF